MGPIPFADAGNPVMAQVAFLTSMISPVVGAAAAQRALEVSHRQEAYHVGRLCAEKSSY